MKYIKISDKITYDPNTGVAWYSYRDRSSVISSCDRGGYLLAYMNGAQYLLHMIVWIHYYGTYDSSLHIDHIDGDNQNNALDNLRLLSPSENYQNKRMRIPHPTINGVYRIEGSTTWMARLKKKGRIAWCCRNESAEYVGRMISTELAKRSDVRIAYPRLTASQARA